MPEEYPDKSAKETWDEANRGKHFFQVCTEVSVHVVVVDGHDYIIAARRSGGVGIVHSASCDLCVKEGRP